MTREPDSNEAWLDALRSDGHEQSVALEALRRRLLRVLPAGLGNHGQLPPPILEDIVQESLLRIVDRLETFQGRSRFTTWATSIAIRVGLTELRMRQWRDVSLDQMTAGTTLPKALSRGPQSPDAEAEQRRILASLGQAIESALTERQRTALVAEIRGMPQEEIGRRLGMKRNAVYKLAHDARKKLRRTLEAEGISPDVLRHAFDGGSD